MMDELYKALETIRKECNEHERCSDCLLRTHDGGCSISVSRPFDWQLRNDKEDVPRLFE